MLRTITLILVCYLSAGITFSQDEKSVTNDSTTAILKDGLWLELGPYGKGHGSFRWVLKVNYDKIEYCITSPNPSDSNKEYLTSIDSSQLRQILAEFTPEDFEGEKNYSSFGTRDGSYFKVKTRNGERMFINVFSHRERNHQIKPDTIGLDKFERLWKEVQLLAK